MILKHCHCCRSTMPATAAFFHRHAGRSDGWHDECRECRSRLRKASTERRRKADDRTTIRRVAKLIREGQEVPEPEVIVRVAYKRFGGSDGLAKAMVAVYDDPQATLRAKLGVLSALARLTPAADERERLAREQSRKQMAAMDPEDLKRYVERLEVRYCELIRDATPGD